MGLLHSQATTLWFYIKILNIMISLIRFLFTVKWSSAVALLQCMENEMQAKGNKHDIPGDATNMVFDRVNPIIFYHNTGEFSKDL